MNKIESKISDRLRKLRDFGFLLAHIHLVADERRNQVGKLRRMSQN